MSSSLLISEVVGKPNHQRGHRPFCAEVEGNRPGRAKNMLICIGYIVYIYITIWSTCKIDLYILYRIV